MSLVIDPNPDDFTLGIVDSCDLHWFELLLDVAVEGTLSDYCHCEVFVELFNIEVDLEEASIRGANDVTEFLKAGICDIRASSDRQMGQFCVFLKLTR